MSDDAKRFTVKHRRDLWGVFDRETNEFVIGPVERVVAEARAEKENRHAEFVKHMGLKKQ